MCLEQIEALIKMLESGRNVLPLERVQLAEYLRYSVPFQEVEATEQPVFDLIKKCEEEGLYSELTHAARNSLTNLYGYQVLQLV